MKIFYDHQIFTLQKYGGISRYFYEIISHLRAIDGVRISLPVIFSENEYLINAAFYENQFKIPNLNFPFKRLLIKYLHKKNRSGSFSVMESQQFDIYHPTFYDPFLLPINLKKPMVLTVYDMITEVFPEDFKLDDQITTQKKTMAKNASRIIAISHHTKADIMKQFAIPESKIDVIYLGSSLTYNSAPPDPKLPLDYILFVGKRSLYKNFKLFIESVSPLLTADPNLFIIAAGAKPFTKDEKRLFEILGITSKVIHQIVNDDIKLSSLYSHAKAFVFPSLYEGFGIPVLEAFACMCPSVISHSSSLIEVGGDAVVFFDPKSKISMQNAISDVIYNETRRSELIRRGLERNKLFSWKKMALETLDVYRKASNAQTD